MYDYGNYEIRAWQPDYVISPLLKEIKKDKKESENNNMEKINEILNLYKRNQMKEIDRQCDEDIKFIRETSDLAKIANKLKAQALKELNKLYPNKENKDKLIDIFYNNTSETQKEIDKRIEDREEEYKKLNEKIDSVKALIAIAETFEQKMQILKNYEIINKEGIINIC